MVSDEPWCEACIHHLSSTGGNTALGVALFLAGASVAWWGVRVQHARGEDASQLWALLIVLVAIVAARIAARPPPVKTAEVTLRGEQDVQRPPLPRGKGHPYRAAVRRASRLVALPISGAKTAMVVLVSMLVVALGLPEFLQLPKLVEFEIVLAGFWSLWGGVGSWLLYRGFRVSNDHLLSHPRTWWASSNGDTAARWGCLADAGCSALDFLGGGILVLLVLGSWALLELLLPPLFFLVYLAIRSGLASIANDDHDCHQHVGRSLLWGFAWSSVFVLPLAGVLFLVHVMPR